ncbi:MAG: hypothetical protein AMXMBFR34_10020 [Myxococcaceae bacterium]
MLWHGGLGLSSLVGRLVRPTKGQKGIGQFEMNQVQRRCRRWVFLKGTQLSKGLRWLPSTTECSGRLKALARARVHARGPKTQFENQHQPTPR